MTSKAQFASRMAGMKWNSPGRIHIRRYPTTTSFVCSGCMDWFDDSSRIRMFYTSTTASSMTKFNKELSRPLSHQKRPMKMRRFIIFHTTLLYGVTRKPLRCGWFMMPQHVQMAPHSMTACMQAQSLSKRSWISCSDIVYTASLSQPI